MACVGLKKERKILLSIYYIFQNEMYYVKSNQDRINNYQQVKQISWNHIIPILRKLFALKMQDSQWHFKGKSVSEVVQLHFSSSATIQPGF